VTDVRATAVPAADVALPPEDAASRAHRIAVACAYVVALFMSAMDNHIINVMLPTLVDEFGASLASLQWTVIGYVLALAAFIPPAGWIGDRFGTKRVFLVALATFTVASAACGLAQDLPQLVAARVAQGIGGGLLTPVATAMLYRTYPPAERARLTRILLLPILLGPIIAQPLGGLLVEDVSWRLAFYLNVPFGVATIVLSARWLRETKGTSLTSFDAAGFVLAGAGLSLFVYGLSEGSHYGLDSPSLWVPVALGAAGLALFVRVERRKEAPLLNLGLFRDPLFRATNVVSFWNMGAFTGLLFLAPVFLQEARGETALAAGLTSFATAIGVGFSTQTVGRLYPYVGPRRMMLVGSAGLAAMLLAFLLVDESTSLWLVRGMLFLAGFANGATTVSTQTAMFTTVSMADTGSGASLFSAGRQSATAFGVAVLTTVVSLAPGSTFDTFHLAFVAAAVFSVIAGALAWLLIDDAHAAATMHPRAG